MAPVDGEHKGAQSVVAGNRLVPLFDGPARLEALVALIEGAERSLRLLYYIYAADAAGTRVRDALVAALGRGVSITIILDGFGSSETSDAFLAPLRDAGADLCRFLPSLGRRYLLRNHQKLALADEARAIVGGFNVSDAYFGSDEAAWRDLGLFVEGPAAARLAGYFDALAAWTRIPRAPIRLLRRALYRWSEPKGLVRWLLGGPARRLSPWVRTIKRDLRSARRLDMIAAYFAPNLAMLRRLERIARRGGTVRILTAAHSDNDTTVAAARHCYRRLLKAGVRIFEYQPARLHTKLFLIDNKVSIGSANFDMRSLYLNMELMLRIRDSAFSRRMSAYFEGELAQSHEITRASHRAASSLLHRLRWGLAYFLVAVVDYGVSRRLNIGAD